MRLRLKHDRLARELARRGRTQNAWAVTLGLDSGHLSKLVNGLRPYPGAATRRKLLEGLGLELEELFEIELPGPRRRRPPPVPTRERDNPMELWSDLRYALRAAARRPGFAVLVVLVLALGLGSTSAVFGLVDAVLVDPLPFPEPERLVLLWSEDESEGGRGGFSFPDFRDVQSEAETLRSVAAFGEENFILGGEPGSGAERVLGEFVTEAYFRILDVEAARGRTFTGFTEGDAPVALLSDALFRRRFGADDSIVGGSIAINDASFRVIGVLPPGFGGLTGRAELFVPMECFDVVSPELRQYAILNARGTRWHSVLARLADGVELGAVEDELSALAQALADAHPRSNENRAIAVVPAYDEIVGEYRGSILLLSAAVGFLLLLACANIANLFLARVLARRHEIGVRVALGASRFRLARQLLTETTLFSLAGAIVGVGIGYGALELAVNLAPVSVSLPSYVTPSLSPGVVAITFVLAVLTGIAFGVLPAAIQMPTARSSATSMKHRAQAALAFAEIALATLLLVGAGLLVKSFAEMQRFDPGFDANGLLTMRFYAPDASASKLDRITEEASVVPGVEAASVASHLYFGGGYMSGDFFVEGYDRELHTFRHYVGPEYFRVMGLPLLRGRAFEARDRDGAPPVVIVNESFASSMWPGEDAVGKRVSIGSHDPDEPWAQVVGVVPDVKPRLRLTTESSLPQVYIPMHQGGEWSRALVVRTEPSLDPMSVLPGLIRNLQSFDAGIAVYGGASMNDLLARSRETARAIGYFMSAFATLALVLAAFGLYAVVSYAVGQSMREIGIRVALGALRGNVLRLVLHRAAVTGVSGLAAGLAMASVLTRWLASFLYDVQPLDAATYVAVGGAMLAVLFIASLGPALRAANVDPVTTLRQD